MARRALLPTLIAALVMGSLMSGCAPTLEPKFEDSNQVFLEKTVNELNLGEKIVEVLPSGSKVSLVSLEREVTGDRPILAVIEDQLIRSLMEQNFEVLERDHDILSRLVAERSGEHFRLTYLPSDVVISSVGGSGGIAATNWITSSYLHGGARVTEIAGVGRDSIIVFETQLDPADYLVSYRVLECGIVYRKGEEKAKKREAMVGLHVRVQDTHSGKILYASNIRGSLEDEVDKEILEGLEDFRYSFYSHDLPMEQGAPTGRREVKGKQLGSRNKARLALLIAGAFVAGIVALQ